MLILLSKVENAMVVDRLKTKFNNPCFEHEQGIWCSFGMG
jgi:hypothetical protein